MYESIPFPDQEPTPLKKLAWHIFAICANSASCERLFSKFGLILTQLHSRMQLKNLLNITELALHLQDEYSQSGKTAERLRHKRKIIPDAPTTTNPIPSSSIPSAVATSSETGHQGDTSTPDPNISNGDAESFAEMVDILGQRSDADDEGDADDFTSPFEKVSLVSLFNFQDQSWAEMAEKFSLRSLDEELELYELIDLDAEGEDDEQEFDTMMSSTV